MKKVIISALISTSLIILAGCSHAAHAKVSAKSQQTKNYDKMVENCISENSKTSSGAAEYNAIFVGCHEYGVEEMDKEILRLSQKITQDFSGYEKETFNEAQKSWKNYREKQCHFESLSVGTPQLGVCLLNMTKSRLTELQTLLQNSSE